VLCRGCGAPVEVPRSASVSGGEYLLAPLLDRVGATKALRDWAGSRRFAPRTLKSVDGPEQSRLVFIPHWSVDAVASTSYTGERGDAYFVTETTQGSNGSTSSRTVRKVRWRKASGEVANTFADLLIAAVVPFHRERVRKLAPWPLAEARRFDPQSPPPPHQVMHRDFGPDDAFDEAKGLMSPVIQKTCRKDIGGSEQRLRKVDTTYRDVAHRPLLLPAWTAGYRHKGKAWHVLINATTGEVVGERPYSAWKITVTIAVVVLVLAALAGAIATR